MPSEEQRCAPHPSAPARELETQNCEVQLLWEKKLCAWASPSLCFFPLLPPRDTFLPGFSPHSRRSPKPAAALECTYTAVMPERVSAGSPPKLLLVPGCCELVNQNSPAFGCAPFSPSLPCGFSLRRIAVAWQVWRRLVRFQSLLGG